MSHFKRVLLLFALLAPVLSSGAYGQKFYGDLILKPLDGVKMEVMSVFGYVDKAGRKWEVPIGHKTDGASIPWQLWSVVGSPFTGNYLKGAVIHDVYCDLKSRNWKEVHQTFYDTMLMDGVGKLKAKAMYAAVYRFGPRWVVDRYFECPPGYACWSGTPRYVDWLRIQPRPAEDAMRTLERFVSEKDPSLQEIAQLADEGFFAEPLSNFEISGRVLLLSGEDSVGDTEWVDSAIRLLKGGYSATDDQRNRFPGRIQPRKLPD